MWWDKRESGVVGFGLEGHSGEWRSKSFVVCDRGPFELGRDGVGRRCAPEATAETAVTAYERRQVS